MADVKLTDKPIAVLASGASLVVTQLVNNTESVRRVSAADTLGYVTPEMYGAVGDGVHDDGPAIKAALETEKPVRMTQDLYMFSRIRVMDHNVDFDGCGHTLHVDLSGIQSNDAGLAFVVGASINSSSGAVKIVYSQDRDSLWEYWYPDAADTHNTDIYGYGYLSYKGEIPVPAWLRAKSEINPVIQYFNEYHADIRNLVFSCTNAIAHYGIALLRMCHSKVTNVTSVCEVQNDDGLVGIWINRCYDILVENCTCIGWNSSRTWNLYGTGYGMQVAGCDKVTVRNYIGRNNSSNFNLAGDRYVWTSRFLLDGAHMSYDAGQNNTRPGSTGNGTVERYATIFNAHADAVCPIFSNISAEAYNHRNRELVGFRCPDCIVSNLYIHSDGGMVAFSEYPERIYINGLVAPGISFQCYGGGTWEYNPIQRDIILVNSHVRDVEGFTGAVTLRILNSIIDYRIWNVSHLVMTNSKVLGDQDWLVLTPVIVKEDALISNCEIWANKSPYTTKRTPVIKGPANKIQMSNCLVRLLPGNAVFENEQQFAKGIRTEHRLGVILNSDYCLLDAYFPFADDAEEEEE